MQAILEATVLLEIQLEEEAAAAAARVLRIDESTELSPDVVHVRARPLQAACMLIKA